MTELSLDASWAKLRWAWYHFERLRLDVDAFEQTNPYTIHYKVNDDRTMYEFVVTDLSDIDPRLGLRIGDCVHNARAALDYLIVRLVALHTGIPPAEVEDVQFPIYSDPGRYKGAVSKLRGNMIATGHLTRIEELQPFNAGDASIWSEPAVVPVMLDRLSKLDNLDKHRVLNPTWHTASMREDLLNDLQVEICEGHEVFQTGKPLDNAAYVGCVHFEKPVDWQPSHIDMKRYFATRVAVGEADGLKPVCESLAGCIWAVDWVLHLFEPVFAHGWPARSVTVIDNSQGWMEADWKPSAVEG